MSFRKIFHFRNVDRYNRLSLCLVQSSRISKDDECEWRAKSVGIFCEMTFGLTDKLLPSLMVRRRTTFLNPVATELTYIDGRVGRTLRGQGRRSFQRSARNRAVKSDVKINRAVYVLVERPYVRNVERPEVAGKGGTTVGIYTRARLRVRGNRAGNVRENDALRKRSEGAGNTKNEKKKREKEKKRLS